MVVARRKAQTPRRTEVDATVAQRDAAITRLRAVLGLVDRRSYMAPEQQAIVADADALVTESERW